MVAMKTNNMLPVVLSVGLLLAAGCRPVPRGLDIVKDGQPQAVIVITAQAAAQIRPAGRGLQKNEGIAAQVLAEWVKKMSGAELPIVQAPPAEGAAIYVGQAAVQAGLTLDDV
jgi:hypothetical protein